MLPSFPQMCPVLSHPPSPLESILTLLHASPLVSVRHLADGRAISSEITSLTTRSTLTPLLNNSLSLHATHPKWNSISLLLSYWAPASVGRRRAPRGPQLAFVTLPSAERGPRLRAGQSGHARPGLFRGPACRLGPQRAPENLAWSVLPVSCGARTACANSVIYAKHLLSFWKSVLWTAAGRACLCEEPPARTLVLSL